MADRIASFELLSRRPCPLCDHMREVLDEVFPSLGLDYTMIDVDRDPDLRERFGDVVPVLLRDGRPVAKVRIDERQLLRIVRRRR